MESKAFGFFLFVLRGWLFGPVGKFWNGMNKCISSNALKTWYVSMGSAQQPNLWHVYLGMETTLIQSELLPIISRVITPIYRG